MNNSITISGQVIVTNDETDRVKNLQFLPDDEQTSILEEGSQSSGQLQILRSGAFDYTAFRPRTKANSTLLRKAAHGRISATKDGAYQMTLKLFKREGLNVKETLAREAMDLIQNVNL